MDCVPEGPFGNCERHYWQDLGRRQSSRKEWSHTTLDCVSSWQFGNCDMLRIAQHDSKSIKQMRMEGHHCTLRAKTAAWKL